MVLDATGEQSPQCYFWKFPFEVSSSMATNDDEFVLQLDDHNVFTAHGFQLDLPATNENPSVRGQANWDAPTPLPATWWNPTIMGWFSWLPRGFMQCSHGVVSVDHSIRNGQVRILTRNNDDGKNRERRISLEGARGYIEKDWGREFPQRYTWIQANDFYDHDGKQINGASLLVSVASIPVKPLEKWLQFTGFLSFLRYPDPDNDGAFRTMRFATYTGAKASYIYNITKTRDNSGESTSRGGQHTREHKVVVTLENWQHRLTVTVSGDRDGAATLWGPLPGNPSAGMLPYVREMLQCPVHVVLERKGVVLFEGTAQQGGFEIEGHDEEPAEEVKTY